MKIGHLKNWIIIIVLWIGIALSCMNGLIGEIQLQAALILLVIVTIINFVKPSLGVKFILGLLVLGFLGILTFFPFKTRIGYGNSMFLFDFYFLALAVIHLALNKSSFLGIFSSVINGDLSNEQLQKTNRVKIDTFKKRFYNKTISELTSIVEHKRLLPEALQAAQELLDERSNMEEN